MPTPQPGDPDFDWSKYDSYRAATPDPVAEAKLSLNHQAQQKNDYNINPLPSPNSAGSGGLASRIKAAHPGAYDDIEDADLEQRVLSKYPEYRDMATPATAEPKEQGWLGKIGSFAKDALPYVGAAALPAAAAMSGPVGWAGAGLLALTGGIGGAGFKHAINAATGETPVSTSDSWAKDFAEPVVEGTKAGAIEAATLAATPYAGAGLATLGRLHQRGANALGSTLPGKLITHTALPGAQLIYDLVTHKKMGLGEIPLLAIEAAIGDPKVGQLAERLGTHMMKPAGINAPDPDALPGMSTIKRLLGLGDEPSAYTRGSSSEIPYRMGGGVSGPFEEPIPPTGARNPILHPLNRPADDVWGGWPPEGPAPNPAGPDAGYAAELNNAIHAKPTPNAAAVMADRNAAGAFGSTAERSVGPMSSHTDAEFLPESFKKLLNLDNQPTVAAEQGWKERLADIPRTRASDSRGFANGPGEMHSVEGTQDQRTIDLINKLAEEYAGSGTRVTKVNKYPNPTGDDALRKAIRQRGYATGGLKRANR